MSNQKDTVKETVTISKDGTASRTRVSTRGGSSTSEEGTEVVKEPVKKEPEPKKK